MKFFLLAALIGFSSCALFDDFKKREFNYGPGAEDKFQLLIPKGWSKKDISLDSAGYKEQFYTYKNGSIIYFVRAADTTKTYQQFDTSRHIPLVHPAGGLIFKGVDSKGLYWREIRINEFRFGYKDVPTETEARFDSSLNFAALMSEPK